MPDRVAEYRAVRPHYEEFTRKLRDLLEGLLRDEGIDYHLLQARTKSVDSFQLKINSVTKPYQDPLKQITDLSGIRIIVHFPEDISSVADLIEREFVIDHANSVDKKKLMRPDQFGYLSVHYVISLRSDRYRLTEWKDCKGLRAEIQVRTLPQHTWATVSHKLHYKRESDIPTSLLRRMYRVAGMLELIDEEFQAIRHESLRLVEKYPGMPINMSTLANYFQSAPTVAVFEEESYKAGFEKDNNDIANANELVTACTIVGLCNVGDLERFLSHLGTRRSKFFAEIATHSGKKKWKSGPMFSVVTLLYGAFPKKFPKSYLAKRGWKARTIDIIRSSAARSGITQISRGLFKSF